MDGEAASRVEAVQGTYENMPGFLGVLSDGSQVSLIVEAETVVDWEKRVAQTDLHVMASCVPSELVAAAKWSVLGSDYSGGGFSTVLYDVFTDSVVITTTLDPDSVREAINDRLPAGAAPFSNSDVNADSALRVESAAAGSVGRKTRSADTPPFFGGGRIELPDGGCSTGFYISSVSNGTVMVTAGHCGINGDAVLNGNLSRTLGSVSGP